MTSNIYLGTKKILLPDRGLSNGKLVYKCDSIDPDVFEAAFRVFKDKPVAVISDNNPEFTPRKDFIGCDFYTGLLKELFFQGAIEKRKIQIGDKDIYLDYIVDVISVKHLDKMPKTFELKNYIFSSDNLATPIGITHFDPVLAYLEIPNQETLKLTGIEKLYAGMIFTNGPSKWTS